MRIGKMVQRIKYKDINSEVIGYDTETYNGKVTLISNSKKEYLIYDNLEGLINFLTKNKTGCLNFFFNLEYDANAIIKCFPDDNIRQIGFFNKTNLVLNGIKYQIFNLKRKAFIIEKTFNEEIEKYYFYDIAQFYQIGSLEKTYEKVITPIEGKIFRKTLDSSKEFPTNKITNEDIEYCINDSIACQELAEHFVTTTRKIMPVKRFYSPASLGKTLLRMNIAEPYKFKANSIQGLAYKGYNGGRFETIKIGKCSVYQYDINSAYPDALSKLPDIDGYKIKNNDYELESTHSFFNCDFTIPKDFKICPIRYEYKNLLLYPNGIFKNFCLTKTEYETLIELGIKIKINNAEHIFNDNPTYPYKFLEKIYEMRKKYKLENNPLQLPLKLAMNSIYGVTIQTIKDFTLKEEFDDDDLNDYDSISIYRCKKCKIDYKIETLPKDLICSCGNYNSFDEILLIPSYKLGNFFNPIIASEITADVRCKLYMDSLEYDDSIYMYATDSITTDKKLNLNVDDKLGNYSITDKLDGVIFGSGIYSLHNEKEHKVRFRGFNKKDTMQIAINNPDKNVYIETIKRPIKLRESLIQKDMGIENMNTFREFHKEFKANFDIKRLWDRKAFDFKDLLNNQIDSIPKNIQTNL